MSYHLDFESSSLCPIGLGMYRYSADPSTVLLLMAIAEDDEDPVVWRIDDPDCKESKEALRRYRKAVTTGALIYSHNCHAELAMCHYCIEGITGERLVPAVEQWRCTSAMGRTCGLPQSLDNAAKFLKLPQEKSKTGRLLIHIFSDRAKLVTLKHGKESMKSASPILETEIPWNWTLTLAGKTVTVREAWGMFIEYCRQDVVVERAIHSKLGPYELKGGLLDGFLFDLRMNLRGVPVDVPALTRALTLVQTYEAKLTDRFREITGIGPGQRDRALEWMRERGYPEIVLQAGVIEEVLNLEEDPLTPECREALEIRHMLGFAAVKKIKAMLEWVCPDGRIRGAFTWYGAQKTGRWTSQGPQFQNLKKPPKWMKPMMATIYQAVAEWADTDDLAMLWGNPFEVLACCARYFVREKDEPIYDADFAQVEARILPALIDCQRILDKFRAGEDIYMGVANAMDIDRDLAKIISLLCQFGGGWRAVKVPLGDKISERDARRAVRVYREENPEVKAAWKTFGEAFVQALNTPGKWIKASKHVKFGYVKTAPFPRMLMRLPSGRDIVYPYPKAEPITMFQKKKEKVVTLEDGTDVVEEGSAEWKSVKGHIEFEDRYFFHTHELFFYGHVKGVTYGWVKTYGGDLLQSATQGTGMDFLLHGCVVAESRGFEPFLVVHDQALAKARGGLDEFIDALCTRPSWFPDFPLEAEGTIAASYSKD